jgi:hypothetical protein
LFFRGAGAGASIGADEQQKQHVLSSGGLLLCSRLNPTSTSFGFTMISGGGGVIASPTSQFSTDN